MKWFEIEFTAGTGDFSRMIVKAKTYEEACGKIQKIKGDSHYRLLAVWHNMEIDKGMMERSS